MTLKGGKHGWMPELLGSPRVRVRVPSEFSLDIRTGGGAIEIEDLEGEVRARTSGGNVRIEEQLRVRGRVGPTRVEAELNEGGDRLRLRTSGGDIQIRAR